MAKFTFLEVHLEDSTLTANTPFGRGEKDVVASKEPVEPEPSSRKGSATAAIIGLVFLVAVAYLAKRKVLDSEGETEFEFGAIGDSNDES
ncbi:MAG: hypothetical protein ACI8UR_002253 [Natronomonas sp.]|jgi:hypothetical protein|uniref:hypothetical protein n=1 Tax=Natronomonas sp. TaxID=2184060 RepID=UPI00398A1293